MVGGAGDTGVGGKGRGVGDTAVAGTDQAQGAVGNCQVGVGEPRHRLVEGNGHQRGAADVLRGVADHDGRGRRRVVGGVRRCADIVEQAVDSGRFIACRGARGADQATVAAGPRIRGATQGGKVGRRNQDRAFVPDGTDTQATVTAIESRAAAGRRTATTAAAGTDVTGNRAGADDGQGGAAGVVDTAGRSAALATGTIPAGATTTTADRQGTRARCTASGTVGIAVKAVRAGTAAARTAVTAHGRVATTLATLVGRAHASGVGTGPGAGDATMPAVAATHRATTATGTTDIAVDHAAATTAARGCVRGHADVIQGQVTEVTDPRPQQVARGSTVTAIAAVAGHQPLGNDQPVQGRGDPGIDREYLGLVLPADGHIGSTVVVQVAIDGQVLGDHQLRIQVDRHARRAESHDIARHRIAEGLAQAAGAGVGASVHGNGGQAVLVGGHGIGRQRVVAFDAAGGDFQGPVAAQAGAVGRRGDVTPGVLRQGVDKTDALVAGSRVAGIDQDIAADIHLTADLRQHIGPRRDVVGGKVGVAQPQVSRVAVGDDFHGAHALVGAQIIGNLLQAVLAGIQHDDLGAGRGALEQTVEILDPGVDEDHRLAGHGSRCRRHRGIGLRVGLGGSGRMIGGRGLRRIGGRVAGRLRGLGHGGGHGTVEQHARFQWNDHG